MADSTHIYSFETRKEATEPLSVFAAVNLMNAKMAQLTFSIIGEVSEFKDRGWSAVYFTIKDDKSALPCKMWTNKFRALGLDIRVGMKITITGKFNIYAAKGSMSFDVDTITLSGEGVLRAQIAALTEKLRKEGLMDTDRKRPVVAFPEAVGLVTSPRGAVVHDVLRTFRRRYPLTKILFAGVPVEGKDAHLKMMEGIDRVVSAGAEEVLLVRGGGSFEDFLPFNEEALARKIVSCPVPVITGIGHEPDTSIADLVADLRASTPTAAAEAVTPNKEELFASFDSVQQRYGMSLLDRLDKYSAFTEGKASRPIFMDSKALISNQLQDVDMKQIKLDGVKQKLSVKPRNDVADIERRLFATVPQSLSQKKLSLGMLEKSFMGVGARLIEPFKQEQVVSKQRYQLLLDKVLDKPQQQLDMALSRLDDLSPHRILSRGWSIAKSSDGSVIKSTNQVNKNDAISITVSDGTIDCIVESTH